MTHAIRIHRAGGPEVLQWESVEVGKPGPGQVRLRQGQGAVRMRSILGFIHHLAHGTQRVGQEILGIGCTLLGQAHIAVEIGVGAVVQHLGQPKG